ncbi:MAG: class I SAM-dependent methyltransferase [Comamonadaceae bacterium]|nr:MAG: class I SAM-dependent methyltransferase [Comamonadaceae bacterium]
MSAGALDQDAVNRGTWKLPATVRQYERLEGWTDPGERAAVEHVTAQVRGRPILDIGVGAGRTTPLLRAVSDDYLGIDYTEEMVKACRARHPGAHIEHMDARDLRRLDAGRFALAVFSFNGIDAVRVEERHQVLREVHRVLQPGGLFIVSAHNRHGPGHGERPRPHLAFSWNPLKLGWRTLKLAQSLPRSWRNSRRLRVLNETHEDWSIMNGRAEAATGRRGFRNRTRPGQRGRPARGRRHRHPRRLVVPLHRAQGLRLQPCAAIQRSILASSISSGMQPSPSTWVWNFRMSKRLPRRRRARSRSCRIFSSPTLYDSACAGQAI